MRVISLLCASSHFSIVCGAYAVRKRVFVSVSMDSGPGYNDLQRSSQFCPEFCRGCPQPAAKAPENDPALKSHSKPLSVNVEMVLVPVTITDPMNRLVTGLDRENF